ncbi:ATP-binding cassette domain-containing protein [Microaerobacter geothermalis]|uniref:ABC transporter ATP-binding protein n=1 Tax=Microaerobacter geothermalis TaxID=674972 RepID=UPI001F4675E4|nr:ATP-binding cassette domain-containing protein [Microaerobacter geothermalis]MCF6094358.1 ATP-binding cassette domain-containing protein [Microaerobacter geothermalis]
MFKLNHVKVKGILDIDQLVIPSHRITCIVGESGSGKTTLLKLLNHLISCDEGEIWVDNIPISQWDPIELRRSVVMLPQTPAIFKGTVRDNLLIGLIFSEKPSVQDVQLSEVLEKVRLHKELDQDADSLSGGEKQRLALARVLLMTPLVLLLDEPSSALDEDTTNFVMQQLAGYVKTQQKTMVMVTHSKAVVQSFADHVVEIHKGRIVGIRGCSG